jgi:hypothetical protein
MIKETELRIGNYVHFVDDASESRLIGRIVLLGSDQYRDILGKGTSIVFSNHNDVHKEYEQLYPLPLNQEILQKCGFPVSQTHVNIGTGLPIRFERRSEVIFLLDENSRPIKRVEYLHEYQNLYFSLVGSEVNIKL